MKKLLVIICVFLSSICLSWEKCQSIEGNCEIIFPSQPHHIKQVIPMQQTNEFLKYDVYLCLDEKDATICMMVIANFPAKIAEKDQKLSLESFFNGIINHKNDKKIVSLDFSKFNNLDAIDFLLEHQNRFFKGKAFIKENKLYLIAMEYNSSLNLDAIFQQYIGSFNFSNKN